MQALYLPIFALCLATTFILSGMESGLLALSRVRIRQLMRQGHAQARVLHGYLQDPEDFLRTILVGNTVSNVVLASLGVLWLHHGLGRWPALFLASLLGGILFFYVFLELLPKMLFRLYPNRLCLILAVPFRILHALLRFPVFLAGLVPRLLGGRRFTGHLFGSREELRLVMLESSHTLTGEERVMINRVMELQNLKVQHITIPLDKTVSVDAATPVPRLRDLCLQHGFSRMPVWQCDPGDRRVVGIVAVKSFLYADQVEEKATAADLMRPAVFLNHDMRLEYALRQMQRNSQRLAVVLGPDRREMGVASLQDILKAIFGEVSL